jgi:hypothetical protein
MIKVCALAALAAMLPGCVRPAASWKGEVKWPETEQDEQSVKTLIPAAEAGAALAAAAAIREMVRTNPFPGLFQGCSSPEQGLDVAVFTGPTPGLYYVVLGQRFDRCGGSPARVLDGNYAYAVTPQGEVVEEAPPPRAEPLPAEPEPYRSSSPSPEPTPSPEGQGRTEHGEERAAEARDGDPHRQVGDANRVIREGRKFVDTETGNTVQVSGDRVVITNPEGQIVTQFKNPKANTQARIQSGRWVPFNE